MSDETTIKVLPADLADLDGGAIEDLSRGVTSKMLTLDWSQVQKAPVAQLERLLQGADLVEHGDSLGIASVPDALAEVIGRVLERGPNLDAAPTPAASEETGSQDASVVRNHLLRTLESDLVGPFDIDNPEATELLRLPPSRWYLTGFLAPDGGRDDDDPTQEDELGTGSDEFEEETAGQEPQVKQRRRLPASIGMTVLLPAEVPGNAIHAVVRYADYRAELEELPEHDASKGKPRRPRLFWRRVPREAVSVAVPLTTKAIDEGIEIDGSGGLWLRGALEIADSPGLPDGTRALSLFIVNQREPSGEKRRQDEQFVFQVELELRCGAGFTPRPNVRGVEANDWDEKVADLQFRHHVEIAVGHGVSVEVPSESPATWARTCWLPTANVPRVITRDEPDVETGMDQLGELADGPAVKTALMPLCDAYGRWLEQQAAIDPGDSRRTDTKQTLLQRAAQARKRIASGIDRLAADPQLLEAFRLMNRAMAVSARRRMGIDKPRWRLFQLAFVLLNVDGLSDEGHPDRKIAELIFFPTGGGKTEAYLGTIAFTLLLRRLRGRERPDEGLGVAVLLRYTLRLLTLDQLGRAATLICALELLRQKDPQSLGEQRFSVGLWVGKSATPNTIKDAAKRIVEYKAGSALSPFPLTNCPWCKEPLRPRSLTLKPPKKPKDITVGCASRRCEFAAARNPDGLPVLFVDEQVYRELPCFIVATVDKFAMLPWRGETGMLFGRATARLGRTFHGAMAGSAPRGFTKLPEGLQPPELIVQDELHLISGPLGTMVGLYETAIDALCLRGRAAPPKLIASTATVRRANDQIQALFGRGQVALFPPPGINDSETYFAKVDHNSPGRLYLGVAASGRAMKAVLLRTYITLLAAAERHFDPKGVDGQAADPYMTVVGYFNSLRELGGMRRLVEDDIRARCADIEDRAPEDHEGKHPWFRRRRLQGEPVELTSRESTTKVTEAKARLELPHTAKEHVDVLLASNMISVGVDIDRLGLMVVAGQPKTTAEYIQASSRVGRQASRPGLVVTCFNVHKPRDRSHYERFTAFHNSFYRFVEATSVTPFSGPALDRGLPGAFVALTRFGDDALTPPEGVMQIDAHRQHGESAVDTFAARAASQPHQSREVAEQQEQAIATRARNLLDAWQTVVREAEGGAAKRTYSPYEKPKGNPLLYGALDENKRVAGGADVKFVASTSMRDVESTVHLWIERRALGGGDNG